MRPTVITDLDPKCSVQQEEIFGPVVTVTPFETEEEVLEMANGTPYGLSASLWTSDNSRVHRLSKKNSGRYSLGELLDVSQSPGPFGGHEKFRTGSGRWRVFFKLFH